MQRLFNFLEYIYLTLCLFLWVERSSFANLLEQEVSPSLSMGSGVVASSWVVGVALTP
jgi:hypothetical protein